MVAKATLEQRQTLSVTAQHEAGTGSLSPPAGKFSNCYNKPSAQKCSSVSSMAAKLAGLSSLFSRKVGGGAILEIHMRRDLKKKAQVSSVQSPKLQRVINHIRDSGNGFLPSESVQSSDRDAVLYPFAVRSTCVQHSLNYSQPKTISAPPPPCHSAHKGPAE